MELGEEDDQEDWKIEYFGKKAKDEEVNKGGEGDAGKGRIQRKMLLV